MLNIRDIFYEILLDVQFATLQHRKVLWMYIILGKVIQEVIITLKVGSHIVKNQRPFPSQNLFAHDTATLTYIYYRE